MAPAADQAHDSDEVYFKKHKDAIDFPTFEQILQMDEDEDEREFSKEIVFDFFQQADNTFKEMNTAMDEKDLSKLSALGHFLKGSSATLGMNKVKDSCEKIQHLGSRKDETGARDLTEDDDEILKRLHKVVDEARLNYEDCESILRGFYD